ncbi:MAG: phosphohistidine phosphatase SixA [Coxiella sp. RIFCSPHIGHO2_12_FULL_44_14]|nr:MAG: phosphohistidine phosphatase SixA [Coxiella sp. RIFCSPHIGHO2_12_FULL_44_14]
MKLYCVRHGHAESTALINDERPLTAQGEEETKKMARFLARQDIRVAQVLHSGKLRARQSAEILAQAIAKEHTAEMLDLLSGEHPVPWLLEKIRHWHDDTLLVGHMPFMSHLVSTLIVGNENDQLVRFSPGTVVCVEQYEHRHWIMDWAVSPDLLID